MPPAGEAPATHAKRLDSFASRGEWPSALTVVPGAIAEAPLSDRLHFQAATLYLYLEDLKNFRAVRDAALAMDETADSVDPANIATAALLMADPQVDLPRAVALAQVPPPPWVQKRTDKWTRVSRALAAYRTERYDEAIALALEGRGVEALGKPYEAQMFLIESMARAQSGEREEAREALRRARPLLDKRFEREDPEFGGGWHNWLTGAILMREAEEAVVEEGN